jgi:hypothetical protein
MMFPFRHLTAAIAVLCSMGTAADPRAAAPDPSSTTLGALRVCADPNNLPFSNQRGEGFENRLASLVARDLYAPKGGVGQRH